MKKNAFSSLELLLTIVISVIMINGIVISIINSMVLNELNQSYSIAINIARAKMEQTIGQKSNFDSITSSGGPLTRSSDGILGRYRIDAVFDAPSIPASNIVNIHVAVCWQVRGRFIGDCEIVATNNEIGWKVMANPTSPCALRTAIARR